MTLLTGKKNTESDFVGSVQSWTNPVLDKESGDEAEAEERLRPTTGFIFVTFQDAGKFTYNGIHLHNTFA